MLAEPLAGLFAMQASDLVVTDPTGVVQVLGTDYEVTGNLRNGTASIRTLRPYTAGVQLTATRKTARVQNAQLSPTVPLPARKIEDELDRRALIEHEQDALANDTAARSYRVPAGEVAGAFPAQAARAGGKFWGWDALGLDVVPLSGTGADAALRADIAAGTGAGLMGWVHSVAGAVVRTLRDRLRDTMHLTDFGASALAADNSAAIQAALAWVLGGDCRRLIVPHGAFNCTASVLVQVAIAPRHAVIEGSGARIVYPAGGSVGTTIEVLAGGSIRGLTIRDLEFQGGRDQLTIKAATLSTTFVYALKIDGVKHYSFLGNGVTLSGNVFEYELCNFDVSSLSLSVFNAITGAVTVGTDPSLLVVSTSAANTIAVGDTVGGIPGARIVSQVSGTPGGVGSYRIDRTLAADVAAQAMITCPVGYGIHILNGPSTGVSSSVLVKGGSTRGGVHGLCHEGPANEINIEDGTYLQAGREGVISTGSQGSVFKKLHVENNWVSAGSVAAGRAGLRVDGVATLIGIRGECNGVTGFQKYVVQCTPTAGGITIIGGQKALGLGASGKFGRYSKPASGELILIGAAPNDYDVISGAIAVTSVGNVISPVQQGYVENFIAYAAAVTPDLSLGGGVRVGALTGNITINNPTNRFLTPAGTSYQTQLEITLQQDATGARTVTWGSDFATGMTAIDAGASKYSTWVFRWIAGKWRQISFASTT